MVWRGYLSIKWRDALMFERRCEPFSVHHVLKIVIQVIWHTMESFWHHHRNTILHANDLESKLIWESPTNAQIRDFYNKQQDQFASTDRIIFDWPLGKQLTSSGRHKKQWLILARRYFSTTATRYLGNQPLVTSFFVITHSKQTSHRIWSEVSSSYPPMEAGQDAKRCDLVCGWLDS